MTSSSGKEKKSPHCSRPPSALDGHWRNGDVAERRVERQEKVCFQVGQPRRSSGLYSERFHFSPLLSWLLQEQGKETKMNDGPSETPLRAFFESTFKGGANTNDWMNVIHAPTSGFGLRSPDGPSRRPSADQRAFYRENGYLLARELVPLELLDELRLRLRRLDYGGGAGGRDAEDDGASHVLRDVLSRFVRVPTLLNWVEDFCGPDVLSLGAMLVRTTPGGSERGSAARLHQNGHFIPVDSDQGRVVSVWAPLEGERKAVVDALTVLPGTHRGPLLPHDHDAHDRGLSLVRDPPEGITPVAMGAEPGDVVFLHPRLLHGSRANCGSVERTELVAHFAAAGAPFVERPHVNRDYWSQNAEVVRGPSSRL